MKGMQWAKFWWRDWQTDQNLQACSLAAQGLWINMLCTMANADPVGHFILPPRRKNETDIQQVSRMYRADTRQVRHLIGELEMRGVFSRNSDGIIISRRMIRDAERSQEGRFHAAKRTYAPNGSPNGSPNRLNGSHPMGDPSTEAEAEAEAEASSKGTPLTNPKKEPSKPPAAREALGVVKLSRKGSKDDAPR